MQLTLGDLDLDLIWGLEGLILTHPQEGSWGAVCVGTSGAFSRSSPHLSHKKGRKVSLCPPGQNVGREEEEETTQRLRLL